MPHTLILPTFSRDCPFNGVDISVPRSTNVNSYRYLLVKLPAVSQMLLLYICIIIANVLNVICLLGINVFNFISFANTENTEKLNTGFKAGLLHSVTRLC
jgi:hypothetical protein